MRIPRPGTGNPILTSDPVGQDVYLTIASYGFHLILDIRNKESRMLSSIAINDPK
jgi:hypothetical protein